MEAFEVKMRKGGAPAIASGITGTVDRMGDLFDVVKLIQSASLPRELGEKLNEFVRAKYYELWDALPNKTLPQE